jgi:hypothetical protein
MIRLYGMVPAVMRHLLIVVVAAIVSIAVGAVFGWITPRFYIPILIPLATGAAVGVALGFFAHLMRQRSYWFVGAVCVCSWLMCVVVFHWVEYQMGFLPDVQARVQKQYGLTEVADENVQDYADRLLEQRVGQSGFCGFLLYRGRSGLKLRWSGAVKLGSGWAFAVWGLDLIVMLAMILRMGLGMVRRVRREVIADGPGERQLNPGDSDRYNTPSQSDPVEITNEERTEDIVRSEDK